MRPLVSALILVLSFGLPFLVRAFRAVRWGLPVRITVDPANPDPQVLASYLAEVAQRLDERPERMRVVVNAANFAGKDIFLDWEKDRRIAVHVEGEPVARLDLRGRWIPDHPVPLALQRRSRLLRKARPRVLYVDPVDANRFRVLLVPGFRVSPLALFLCMAGATVALVYVVPELLAVSIGAALGLICAKRS